MLVISLQIFGDHPVPEILFWRSAKPLTVKTLVRTARALNTFAPTLREGPGRRASPLHTTPPGGVVRVIDWVAPRPRLEPGKLCACAGLHGDVDKVVVFVAAPPSFSPLAFFGPFQSLLRGALVGSQGLIAWRLVFDWRWRKCRVWRGLWRVRATAGRILTLLAAQLHKDREENNSKQEDREDEHTQEACFGCSQCLLLPDELFFWKRKQPVNQAA